MTNIREQIAARSTSQDKQSSARNPRRAFINKPYDHINIEELHGACLHKQALKMCLLAIQPSVAFSDFHAASHEPKLSSRLHEPLRIIYQVGIYDFSDQFSLTYWKINMRYQNTSCFFSCFIIDLVTTKFRGERVNLNQAFHLQDSWVLKVFLRCWI